MSVRALVLVVGKRIAMPTLGEELAAMPGVTEVHAVTGEWDFVATVETASHGELGGTVHSAIQSNPGVKRIQTLVVLDTFRGSGQPG